MSKSVLVTDDGTILAQAVGPSLNYLLEGADVVFARVKDHVRDLRQKSSTDEASCEIVSIGLCLSGCEEDEANRQLEQDFLKSTPKICGKISLLLSPAYHSCSLVQFRVAHVGKHYNEMKIQPTISQKATLRLPYTRDRRRP